MRKAYKVIACMSAVLLLTACDSNQPGRNQISWSSSPTPHVVAEHADEHDAGITQTPVNEKEIVGNNFTLYKNGTLVFSGGDVTMPLKDYEQLSDEEKRAKIVKIEFRDDVKRIGDKVFADLPNLKQISLQGEISIGAYAFAGCTKLSEIDNPENIVAIGAYAFNKCGSLESISIGSAVRTDAVVTIGDYAFSECGSLKRVSIGAAIQADSVGKSPFAECGSLNDVTINCKSVPHQMFSGCSSLETLRLGEMVNSIGNSAFQGCTNLNNIDFGSGITSIGDSAFQGCRAIKQLNNLPEKLTRIGTYAFADCDNLHDVVFPAQLTTIGRSAFENCSKLSDIRVDSQKKLEICTSAFSGCAGLTKLNISVKSIDSYAFSGCTSLLRLDAEGETIGEYAFNGCTNLSGLNISVKSINSYAFSGCTGLLRINAASETIGEYAFQDCRNLSELTLTTNAIGTAAFSGCMSLNTVHIGKMDKQAPSQSTYSNWISVDKIGTNAFRGCALLGDVQISAREISDFAFDGCSNLMNVCFSNAEARIGSGVLQGCTSLKKLELTLYDIPESAFVRLPIKTLWLASSVRSIGERAFMECENMDDLVLPDHVSIGNYAFQNCTSLARLGNGFGGEATLNGELGERIFDGCSRLSKISVAVKKIPYQAFTNMTALSEINMIGVEEIGMRAFAGDTALRILDFGEEGTVQIIGDEAFADCTSLEKVRLPASLKKLGWRVFINCGSLGTKAIIYGGEKSQWAEIIRPGETDADRQSALRRAEGNNTQGGKENTEDDKKQAYWTGRPDNLQLFVLNSCWKKGSAYRNWQNVPTTKPESTKSQASY